MIRLLAALFLSTLLGGCIVLPLDYDHRGGARHGHHHRHWSDRHDGDGSRQWRDSGDRNWRYRDRR